MERFVGVDTLKVEVTMALVNVWLVPGEALCTGHDIVQETGIKTIPMEKKCKKAKWLSGEALQIAVKRREAKSKGEKERYKHLNAESSGSESACKARNMGSIPGPGRFQMSRSN